MSDQGALAFWNEKLAYLESEKTFQRFSRDRNRRTYRMTDSKSFPIQTFQLSFRNAYTLGVLNILTLLEGYFSRKRLNV